MAIAAWAEQQQRELNLRARRLARSKVKKKKKNRWISNEVKPCSLSVGLIICQNISSGCTF